MLYCTASDWFPPRPTNVPVAASRLTRQVMWSQPRHGQSPGFAISFGMVRPRSRASSAKSHTSAVARGYSFPNPFQTVSWNSATHHGQPCCPGPGTRSHVRSCASFTQGPLFDPLGISTQPTRRRRAARVRSFGVLGMAIPPGWGRLRLVRLWLGVLLVGVVLATAPGASGAYTVEPTVARGAGVETRCYEPGTGE